MENLKLDNFDCFKFNSSDFYELFLFDISDNIIFDLNEQLHHDIWLIQLNNLLIEFSPNINNKINDNFNY